MKLSYIGDSVYVHINEISQLVLETRNGLITDPSNRIVLEPEVLFALISYALEAGYVELPTKP